MEIFLKTNVVYQVTIRPKENIKIYTGVAEDPRNTDDTQTKKKHHLSVKRYEHSKTLSR